MTLTTPPATVPTPVTIALLSRKLRQMLNTVSPHMALDDHPTLCGVRLEITRGTLYVLATDRYSLAVTRHRVAGQHTEPISMLIRREHVPALTKLLKHAPQGESAQLTFTPRDLTVTTPQGAQRAWAAPTSELGWRSAVATALERTPQSAHGVSPVLDPHLLARLSAAGRGRRQFDDEMHIRITNAAHPVVCFNADTLYLLMPQHTVDETAQLPNPTATWREELTAQHLGEPS